MSKTGDTGAAQRKREYALGDGAMVAESEAEAEGPPSCGANQTRAPAAALAPADNVASRTTELLLL